MQRVGDFMFFNDINGRGHRRLNISKVFISQALFA